MKLTDRFVEKKEGLVGGGVLLPFNRSNVIYICFGKNLQMKLKFLP